MPAQAQRSEEMTISEKMQIVQALSIYPAITVLVFIRRKVGFRMLKPGRLIAMYVVLSVINDVFGIFSHGLGFFFTNFPLAMLAFGFGQRWLRWRELCKGERWHTMSPGISYLELLPLPAILTSHRRIYRFLEPIGCYILGCVLVTIGLAALGRWIAFAGFALFIFEQSLFEKQLDRDLDILDGLVVAEVQTETVEHFAGPQSEEKERTLQDTAGIPTGVAFDIHKQIELRRAKRRSTPAES